MCKWIEKEQWERLEKKVYLSNEKYVLTYFLGEPNHVAIEAVVGQEKCVKVDAGPKMPYGPGEFIYLLHNAKVIMTDSFHAVVFSMMFGIEVYICQRNDEHASMNSRIETLLKKTGILYSEKNGIIHIDQKAFFDSTVQQNMRNEREIFNAFLKHNITA